MSDKHFDDKLYIAKKFTMIMQILDGRIFEDQNIFYLRIKYYTRK